MNSAGISDRLQTLQLQRRNAELQRTLARLTQETATGLRADISAAAGRDFAALAYLDHAMETVKAYQLSTSEAALYADALQDALGAAQTLSDDAGAALVSVGQGAGATQIDAAARGAAAAFRTVVAALNTQVAGRYLLAGSATDTRPLAAADDILQTLKAATSGLTTAAEITAAVNGWFDAPKGSGGFLDTGYFGAASAPGPMRTGEGRDVRIGTTGADPRIRNLLKGHALAALASDGALSGDTAGRGALARAAGLQIASAATGIIALRAEIGTSQAVIDAARSRNSAEQTALQLARAGIAAADPYQTATDLEAVRTQIESLYTATARIARLSLADYLR